MHRKITGLGREWNLSWLAKFWEYEAKTIREEGRVPLKPGGLQKVSIKTGHGHYSWPGRPPIVTKW